MGLLTTVTIYHDSLHDIEENKEEFMKQLLDALKGDRSGLFMDGNFSVGGGCCAKVHKTRHADEHTVFVHAGNTVMDMHGWSDEVAALAETHPNFFNDLLNEMQRHATQLKKVKKGIE